MSIRLPSHFRARTMPDETRVTLSCRNNQKSWNGIHAVSHTFSPLEDPIDGQRHVAGQRHFNVRMCVDEVNRARSSGGEDAKIVAFRKQGIERSERVCPPVVAARDISLSAEPWFERHVWQPVPGFGGRSPRPNICGSEAAELPQRFIIEIPSGCRLRDGTGDTRADAVSPFVAATAVELRRTLDRVRGNTRRASRSLSAAGRRKPPRIQLPYSASCRTLQARLWPAARRSRQSARDRCCS